MNVAQSALMLVTVDKRWFPTLHMQRVSKHIDSTAISTKTTTTTTTTAAGSPDDVADECWVPVPEQKEKSPAPPPSPQRTFFGSALLPQFSQMHLPNVVSTPPPHVQSDSSSSSNAAPAPTDPKSIIQPSLVQVQCRMPFPVDAIENFAFAGTGIVVDAKQVRAPHLHGIDI